MTSHTKGSYYLPPPSKWPLVGSAGIFCLLFGLANWLHGNHFGTVLFGIGAMLIIYMIFGWFGTVIRENEAGLLNNEQVEKSYRWGMIWFIFSEILCRVYNGGFVSPNDVTQRVSRKVTAESSFVITIEFGKNLAWNDSKTGEAFIRDAGIQSRIAAFRIKIISQLRIHRSSRVGSLAISNIPSLR